jgi:hypothetical protein
VFVIGVACAKVDRGYEDDDGTLAGADSGGSSGAGHSGGGGKAGSGIGGKPAGGSSSDAGSAGETEAGSGGENSAGAAGAASGTLQVVFAGDGAGTVKADQPGIDCTATCSAEFDPDTKVVLTATPAANSTFTGWSGGGCSGTGTCTVVLADSVEVRAEFTANSKLTVTLAGNGAGAVKSVPAGIDCGTTCSVAVTKGSSIQLVATPAVGSVFGGWSGGGCTGTGACTTTVTAATTVIATFTQMTPTLTVTKAGTGTGTVTSVPDGINCGTVCSEVVNYGAVVTLSAVPTAGSGSAFGGWSGGGCSGTGTCVVTVTAATQVTATFTCTGTVTLNYTGALASFAVPSCVTSLTIDAYGAQGGSAGTYAGGLGARMKGTFTGLGGSTLKVLVGGKGLDALDTSATVQQAGGSGGGGTFVTNAANSALIVAGGGGGAINAGGTYAGVGLNASIGTSGTYESGNLKAGGINGNGGTTGSNLNGYHPGTAGGGFLSNGVGTSDGSTSSYGPPYTPGFAFVNGGGGGQPGTCPVASTTCIAGRPGGFGGGGAAGYTGGGGGGYSGGASGSYPGSATATGPYLGGGGGGGSYAGGTAQTNTAGARLGAGTVIFSY